MALGMVMQLPEGDQQSRSRRQLMAELDVCMGGRVAEELIFGNANITTGASSDLQKVLDLTPLPAQPWTVPACLAVSMLTCLAHKAPPSLRASGNWV